ncbi:unnamed protein product [Victoria cruziana]
MPIKVSLYQQLSLVYAPLVRSSVACSVFVFFLRYFISIRPCSVPRKWSMLTLQKKLARSEANCCIFLGRCFSISSREASLEELGLVWKA